jgi:hypothetical protein
VEPYSSYRSLVMSRFYDHKFVHSLVPGALREYDLPDLAMALAPAKLLIAGMTDANGQHKSVEEINKDIETIKIAYRFANAEGNFKILQPGVSGWKDILEWAE